MDCIFITFDTMGTQVLEKDLLENEYVKFERRGLVVVGTYKANQIDLALAKKIVQDRLTFSNFEDVPLLITEFGLRGIDRDARTYFSSDDGIKGILASAIVTNSAVTYYLAIFFLKISVTKVKFPAKVFKSEDVAVAWLNSFVEQVPN